MAQFDMALPELEAYLPSEAEPRDFDEFWTNTLAEARIHPLAAQFEQSASLASVEVYDVRFTGWNGERIAAWLSVPRDRSEPLPLAVQFNGYGDGRGMGFQHTLLPAAGYAHLVMDNRGQGAGIHPGDTPDPDSRSTIGQHPGFMTRGLTSPETYYYRRLIVDAVRAVEAGRSHPMVDPGRVALFGRSQGGALAVAATALTSDVGAVHASVPFLSNFRRAVRVTDRLPYAEIARYLRVRRLDVEAAFNTLDYFDIVHFARRAAAPAIFSVGLMDDICPPSTVYAAYNNYAGSKRMRVWEFNGHEAGDTFDTQDMLAFFESQLSSHN